MTAILVLFLPLAFSQPGVQAEADKSAPSEAESLSKMSFGDHLEELRRRIVLSLIAVGVCVFAMLPFKTQVTAIYVQPYHDMWMRGFL